MHSCPHLGYLNYICNAYRGAVGTEYVGAAASRMRRDVGDERVTLNARALPDEHTRTSIRSMLFYVCVFAVAEACRRSLRAVARVSDRVSRVQATRRRATRVHECEIVITHAAPRNRIAYKRRISPLSSPPDINHGLYGYGYGNLHWRRVRMP